MIATVGRLAISADEFRDRFELNPRLLQYQNPEYAKLPFLGVLIAEKLLALEAEKQRLLPPARTLAFLEQIKREAVIEAFYHQEIAVRIEVSDAELRQAYARQRRVLEIEVAAFKTRQQAEQFRRRVLAGETFAQALTPALGSSPPPIDTLQVRWGSATPAIEDKLFALKTGELSAPIPSLGEFHVARLLNETVDAFPTEEDFQQKREALARNLLQRKRRAAFADYFKKMMAGKRTRIPPERFKFLVVRLEELFLGQAANGRHPNPSPLNPQEFAHAEAGLAGHWQEVLVTFDDGSTWTMREFLQRLSVGRHLLDFRQRRSFRFGLRQALLAMVEQEYIYKEAVRRGLDETAEVREAVAMWRDNLLARHLLRQLLLPQNEASDEQEIPALREEQLQRLTTTLLALSDSLSIRIDQEALRRVPVRNAGMLAVKTHFPGRLVVPLPLPLENLAAWQEKIFAKLGYSPAPLPPR
ncbi:MAG: hypothetical protein ONB48_10970 [candidate division KSB1 bacterium]|nr:hypothetical protein [candidate division KSB1 bacterium]MDZ7275524.1 hypothetical protein [candidate division KSB1 bacterium]MDZ7286164.1 hypothetical protein [candidate division KSB1 bacterium]MDZ7296390.1 hypothetical protein [candidate division KSB1 bacterium]MDZ7306225.1 hypothetical protein [candidate division KSB1 bacterium]